jgi:hypothetical protein
MLDCPVCGQELPVAPENATDAFHCEKCGNRLRASLRFRTIMLSISSAAAVLLRFATLRFNPRFNLQKTSTLPFAVEALVTRFLWRTGLIKIDVAQSPGSKSA